jgi:hypothetical protein
VVKNCFKQNGSLHPNSKPTLLLPYSKEFLESNKNWKLAELVILSCKECSDIYLSSLDITHDIDEDDNVYECEVELITVIPNIHIVYVNIIMILFILVLCINASSKLIIINLQNL